MPAYSKYLLFIIAITWPENQLVMAQNLIETPVIPDQYYRIESQFNPAYNIFQNKLSSNILYQGYSGLRKNRRNIFFDISLSTGLFGKEKPGSVFGFFINSQQIGKYINKNRYHILYSRLIPISKEIRISAGISMGFFNQFISDNPSGVSYSVLIPDGNLGVQSVIKDKFSIGLAANQFLNNTFNNSRRSISLKRHYLLSSRYKTDITPFWDINTGILMRILPENQQNAYINAIITYKYLLGFGLSYGSPGLGFLLQLSVPEKEKTNWSMAFSYNTEIRDEKLNNSNTYNLSLNLYIK